MRVKRSKKTEWRTSFASMSDIAFLLIIFFALAGKFTKQRERRDAPQRRYGGKITPA
ncbi:MAG: hypothetical protein KGZ25_12720 [Planctomycetes bacterium]|nr:hypothetical protein [Planctomycetota bacterium]